MQDTNSLLLHQPLNPDGVTDGALQQFLVDHQDAPEPNMVLALMEMSDMLSKTRKQAESLLLSAYHGQMYSNDYAESTLNFDDRIQSVYLSPLIGPENALVVKINSDNGLTPCLTALKEMETLFTEFTPVLTDSQHQRVIRNDQWDTALQITDQINHTLMSNTAEGFVSVIKEDTINHQWCLVREPIDEDGPLLHGMSPWD